MSANPPNALVPADLRQAWDIARQMLEAVELAHTKGIVHGDLKPSNLVADAQGRVSVSDFGVAAAAGAVTPYTAPEQLAGGPANVRTDLYRAGAIVYELISGKAPFTGSREELAQRIAGEAPPAPSSHAPRIAWQLDTVLRRALAKKPADRYGSAREFLEGLRLGMQESLGKPLPPLAPPPATVEAPGVPAAAPRPVESRLAQSARLIAKPSAAPVARVAPVPSGGRTRVLFVDDEERILNALQALFRADYDVFTAASGAAALEIVGKAGIHIVVSDQRMPGMTGVELLREVRRIAPHTVRLLLTGYSDLPALVGCVNEGEVFRYVKKPWDNAEIRATLAAAAALVAKLAPGAPRKAPSPRSAGSLLVIDPGQSLAKGLERLLAGEAKVLVAATVGDAAKLLQQHEIAAIVADLAAGKDALVKLFSALKEKRPEVHSILVSKDPDAELIAELINSARIYRFLAKPIDARELRAHVAAALRRYALYREAARAKASGPAQGAGSLTHRPLSRSA